MCLPCAALTLDEFCVAVYLAQQCKEGEELPHEVRRCDPCRTNLLYSRAPRPVPRWVVVMQSREWALRWLSAAV